MKHLYIILFVVASFTLNGQVNTYSKLYDFGFSNLSSTLLVKNQFTYVLANRVDTAGRSINLLTIDNKGNLINNTEQPSVQFNYYMGSSGSIHLIDSVIFAGGFIRNHKTGIDNPAIYRFNLESNSFVLHPFSDTTKAKFRSLDVTFDDGFIALGTMDRPNGNEDLLLVKFDGELNEEWVKTYGDGFNDEEGFYVEQLQDSTYLLSGAKDVNNYIVHVNDTGKVLSWEVYHANYGGCLTVQSKDSNYLMQTTEQIYFPSLPGLGSIHTLRKINASNNQVIWESQMFSGYQGEFSSRPIEVENGNIYVAGFQIQEWDTLGNGNVVGRLACFSPDGDSLWSRTYLVDSIGSNYIYDMARTEDGYFVMTGSAHGWDQDVWVLKVDSNGCVVEGCGKPSVQEIDETMGSFFMYPNPTKNQLQLSLYLQATEIKLFNLHGQLVLNQTIPKGARQMNLQLDLPNGLYLVQVLNNGKLVGQEKLVVE